MATPFSRSSLSPLLHVVSTIAIGAVGVLASESAARACASDAQCLLADPLLPICAPTGPLHGQCVACLLDADCGALAQCVAGLCICLGPDCAGDGGAKDAAPATDGPSTTCAGDAECLLADPLLPVCATVGPLTGQCVACVTDSNCAGGTQCIANVCLCVGSHCSADGGVASDGGPASGDGGGSDDGGGVDAGTSDDGAAGADGGTHAGGDGGGTLALDAGVGSDAKAPRGHAEGGLPDSDAASNVDASVGDTVGDIPGSIEGGACACEAGPGLGPSSGQALTALSLLLLTTLRRRRS